METQQAKMVMTFMRHNRAALLATVTPDGKPHGSVVLCVVHNNFDIYFTTRAEGRKYESLMQNPRVSMVFMSNGSMRQLQLSGVARQVKNDAKKRAVMHELMKRRYRNRNLPLPNIRLFRSPTHKEHVIFHIKPYELTYADFKTSETGVYRADFRKIL